MTVPASSRRAGPFTGNGVTSSFPFTFKVFSTADIQLVRTLTTGTEVALTTGFSVTLNGDQDNNPGGSINYLLASGEKLTIIGALPYEQPADLPTGGAFSATVVENAIDRAVILIQQLLEQVNRGVRLPVSAANVSATLPVPEASKLLGWNTTATALVNLDASALASVIAYGNRRTLVANGGAVDYLLDADPGGVNNTLVAVGGVVQTPGVDYTVSGTTLTPTGGPWPAGTGNVVVIYGEALPVGTQDASNVTFTQTGTLNTRTVDGKLRETVSVFDFMTDAQIADVQAYTFSLDVTAPILAAINAARVAGGKRVLFPAGGYLASIDYTVLAQGGSLVNEFRGVPLTLEGEGNGEPFVENSVFTRGTIVRAVGASTALHIRRDPANPTGNCGTITIKGFRFEATNTAFAVELESLAGQSVIENITVRQYGTGSGMRVKQMSTGLIQSSHFMGPRWALGAPFTGQGLVIEQTVNDNGLPTIRKVTSRGWQWGYVIGAGTFRTYSGTLAESEISVCENGVWLKPYTSGFVIQTPYFEGVTGTCILDQGEDTGVYDGEFLIGFTVGIDGTFSGAGGAYGSTYSGNYFETDDAGGGTKHLIRVESTGAFGGPGRTVTDNRLLSNGAGAATIHGITIQGIDPRINMAGNQFLPRGTWPAPGRKINDISTTAAGAGTGLYGLGTAWIGDYEFPLLSRGAISLGLGPVLTQTDVSANVLTLHNGSAFVLTPTTTVNISSFSAPQMDGKLLWLRITNGNVTLTNGANLRLASGANYTPGANGALMSFLIRGSVAEEASRVAY